MSSQATGPTIIQTITAGQFAARLTTLFPSGWASQDAAQVGVLNAFLNAIGEGLTQIIGQVQYAQAAIYVPTETSPELDLASQDFYGPALPRPPGMSDADYSKLILSGLFQPAATRAAISNALTALTGFTPRMIEPWSPGDTGAWDGPASYWDVDNADTPFLWSGEEQYTGFIETPPPPYNNPTGGNPILCWDAGWFWDIPGSSYFDLTINPLASLYQLVTRLHAWGTTIGIKITQPLGPAFQIGVSVIGGPDGIG